MAKLPDAHEVSLLLDKGVLTKDEAREILFSLETEEDRDKQSLQEEIKFLRQLVKNLSSSPSQIIQYINKPNSLWEQKPWYSNYTSWANNSSLNTNTLYSTAGSSTMTVDHTGLSGTLYTISSSVDEPDFTAIKTF